MTPQEVTDKLQLTQLKDKVWFVVPSCATTGEGLFEGLVCIILSSALVSKILNIDSRAGSPTMSSLNRKSKLNKRSPLISAVTYRAFDYPTLVYQKVYM